MAKELKRGEIVTFCHLEAPVSDPTSPRCGAGTFRGRILVFNCPFKETCSGHFERRYFRKRFSKAWRASRGLEVEVSRSMVVRGE